MRWYTATGLAIAVGAAAIGLTQVAYPPADSAQYVTQSQLASAATTNLNIMAATTPQFVGGSSAYMTLAQLLTNFPASATNVGLLAHVSDAWGGVSTTLVCEGNGGTYYWRPQRTDFASTLSIASGSATLTPLVTAPIIYLPTSPTGTVNLTLSTTNVWPGAQFHIYAPPTISGLGIVNLSGLIGGGTVTLLQGSDKIVTYVAGVGWKSN